MFDSDPNPYLEIGRVLFSINILFKTVIVCPGLDSNPVFIDGQTLILFFVSVGSEFGSAPPGSATLN